jgi:outer membrane biosynthesis protein TonB
MTTAEFIIGHSADDAGERKQEMRKVLWALLVALAIHVVIGYSLAVYGGLLYSPFSKIEEDKPVELSFVDLSTPAPTKNTMFVENDESKHTEAPKDKTFESNANSIAASQQPAARDAPIPTQEGKDRPNFDLDTHPYSLPNQGAQPQPSTPPQQSATPQPTVQPTPISKTDELAMLTSTPRPTVQPTVATKPQQPSSSYRPMKERTRSAGSISNRGISSVNAIGTPLGRYEKMIQDAIGSRWYAYVQERMDLISMGTAQVVFYVDRSGRVKNIKVIKNTSNEAFANVCLQSILEIQVPPIPEDVASTLPPEGLDEQITFTMFPN